MNPRCLILTEAGDGIGFGHLARCSAILEQLNEDHIGAPHEMLVNIYGDRHFDLENSTNIDWRSELSKIVRMSSDFQLVLVDSYLADETVFRTLRQAFEISVAIDDFDRIAYEVDLVLCPNASFEKVRYPSGKSAQKILGGPSLVIIRKPIHEFRNVFTVREEIRRVLITVGGHDVHNLIPPMVESFVDEFDLVVVSGSREYQARLIQQFSDLPIEVLGCLKPQDMARQMVQVDVAITVCGQTLNELAFLGVPPVGICVGKDQLPNSHFYQERQFVPQVPAWDSPNFEGQVRLALDELQERHVRVEKHLIGQRLIDGHGAERICKHISNL